MNRKIYAHDCLDVLNDEVELPSGSVDLIYLDPPFNSKSIYNLPFKGKYKKDVKPVMAFKDTWTWGAQQDEYLKELDKGISTQKLADIVRLTKKIEISPSGKASLSAYLINMAMRLIPMKRVLKKTGSIYLHCDPTASHYLKLIMDAIFGQGNFKNELIWHYYNKYGRGTRVFGRNYDQILFYAFRGHVFNPQREPREQPVRQLIRENVDGVLKNKRDESGRTMYRVSEDRKIDAVWSIPCLQPASKEWLKYPTQKPMALLERIIQASSNPGDLVLDPFCGCGTTVHTAEMLKRNWVGIDVSIFSAGLIRERLLNDRKLKLVHGDIEINGTPFDLDSARKLAERDKFEFEKWVCGAIGAHGMFHAPGDRGPDGGVDGVIEFGLFRGLEQKVQKTYAIVQVKGGKVTPDSVRALESTVRKFEATAGILVCFGQYMKTVDNNKSNELFKDLTGRYPFIQGFSIEQLLNNEKPKLPPLVFRRDARIKGDLLGQGTI